MYQSAQQCSRDSKRKCKVKKRRKQPFQNRSFNKQFQTETMQEMITRLLPEIKNLNHCFYCGIVDEFIIFISCNGTQGLEAKYAIQMETSVTKEILFVLKRIGGTDQCG